MTLFPAEESGAAAAGLLAVLPEEEADEEETGRREDCVAGVSARRGFLCVWEDEGFVFLEIEGIGCLTKRCR